MDMPSSTTTNMTMSDSSSTSNSTTMLASMMTMTFYSSDYTALFSAAWTPSTPAAYAGTCIFLIVFSFIYRGLNATKAVFERRCRERDMRRTIAAVPGFIGVEAPHLEKVAPTGEVLLAEGEAEDDEETERLAGGGRSGGKRFASVASRSSRIRPWRISEDVPRTVLVTAMAGVGYLLMLAVMTLNVGYFLSVLAGIALGELLLGRLAV